MKSSAPVACCCGSVLVGGVGGLLAGMAGGALPSLQVSPSLDTTRLSHDPEHLNHNISFPIHIILYII